MKRQTMWFVLGCALVAAGCNKPTPESCKKALLNMEHILGTDNLLTKGDLEGNVRQCRGGSTKEAVACASAAQTKEDLLRCDFYKVPESMKTDDEKKADDKKADDKKADDKKADDKKADDKK
jgi:hypothetical protein